MFRLLAVAQRFVEALLPELREAARGDGNDPCVLRGVSLRELAEDVTRDRVTLVDLRPSEEYRAGHLPEARSHPFQGLADADLKTLQPRERLWLPAA